MARCQAKERSQNVVWSTVLSNKQVGESVFCSGYLNSVTLYSCLAKADHQVLSEARQCVTPAVLVVVDSHSSKRIVQPLPSHIMVTNCRPMLSE